MFAIGILYLAFEKKLMSGKTTRLNKGSSASSGGISRMILGVQVSLGFLLMKTFAHTSSDRFGTTCDVGYKV